MLGWLKRRARVTINSRYISLLRRNISPDMIVPDSVHNMFNHHNLKLVVLNSEGGDYTLDVPSATTVDYIKQMAIGHFFNPLEAAQARNDDSKTRTYRLVLVREARALQDVNSLQHEQLLDNDELLLVERREFHTQHNATPEENTIPTDTLIAQATQGLTPRNQHRDPDPAHHADFQIEFRRILITMIEASVRLISADPESDDIFTQILEKLERRHRPRIDRNALKQLTDMGFPEAEATKALHVKRTVMEAMEWLLEQGNRNEGTTGSGTGVQTASNAMQAESVSAPTSSTNDLDDQTQDPAKKILKTFLQCNRKWFQPNPQYMNDLVNMGFPEEQVIEALRCGGNKKDAACELLLKDQPMPDDEGLDRDSPIISAIMASPVIQLALPKAKTLLALMMLYESPNNANMWLSDPDTHPVVSQVLRIYHAEKHSLNHNRAAAISAASNSTPAAAVRNQGVQHRPIPAPTHAPTLVHSTNPPAIMRRPSPGQTIIAGLHPAPGLNTQPIHFHPNVQLNIINLGRGASQAHPHSNPANTQLYPNTSSNPSQIHVHSNASSNPSQIHVHSNASSNPLPVHILRQTTEEPMSISGSPVRGQSGTPGIANNSLPPPTSMAPLYVPGEQVQAYIQSAVNLDIEMEEGSESQDMDTQ